MKNSWLKYDEKETAKVMDFCEEYKKFISENKTERLCIAAAVKMAEKKGYKALKDVMKKNTKLTAGDKVYAVHMGKTIALFNIGSEPLEKGMNVLGAHVDSPRLDIKQNPLYEDGELALLDTHYYGGIKKYQWVALPLAIYGVVALKDGKTVNISIGDKQDDPVLGVTDLLIHLSQDQLEKKGRLVIEGEDLNVSVGSIPLKDEEKEGVKKNILNLLKEQYGIEEKDFTSAELEIVPAGKARDYGFDRSMIMGYGQDDRVCAYTSLKAIFDIEKPKKTAVCILTDKEEIGSVGATGMQSRFFENTVAELINAVDEGGYNDLALRRTLQHSKMLSCDVSALFDPNYPSVMEKNNSAYMGKGICVNKYTGARGKSGANDANAEYMAYIRKIWDSADVSWQTCELGKVDQGGGGTIAYIMAGYGMEVIDAGVGVLNMHAPWEVTSKADVYEAFKGYKAFLKH